MEYNKLTSSIVKGLRGDKSQSALSLLLGYEFNIVHRWESGSKRVMWSDFCDLLAYSDIDTKTILDFLPDGIGELSDSSIIIRSYVDSDDLDLVSAQLNTSKVKVYNYINKRTKPDLAFMLNVIDEFSYFGVKDFISLIIPLTEVDYVKNWKNYVDCYWRLIDQKPAISLLLTVLGFDEYKELKTHSTTYLSRKMNLSESHIEKLLQILVENKLLELKEGKYQASLTEEIVYGRSLSPEFKSKHRNYWASESLDFFEKHRSVEPEEIGCKQNTLNTSFDDESLIELKNATNEYLKKVHSISSKSKKHEHIRIININYYDPIKKASDEES